ncbi:sensor histidine kinase [Pontibacter vulgaris]|uniref:sensor histidine kinase n=1 Tax=Pontibacter vulgaris TaxID=2905679 RepID=UPI001FA6FCB9|nr:PAS domain-containing sensor histidine kinase [Pontibacter vulgaris]
MNSNFIKDKIASNFIKQVKEYAIFAIDVDGKIVSWNEGAERMKGFTKQDVIGKYYGMLFTEEDQQLGKPQEQLEATKREGHFEHEGLRRKKDGSLFWAGVALTAIYNDKGELIGFTKVTKDLTDKKIIEETISKKNEELTSTNKDLDNFIYTASHDLKAPILNIEGLIQRLSHLFDKKAINDSELEELVGHILNSVQRFKTTIEDLTTISRLQRSLEEENNEETVDVVAVFEDIKADVDFLFDQFKLPCEVVIDFEVKSLKFSRKNFRSILYNLLSNAIKYRSMNCDCKIEVKTFREKEWVVLVVKDNGLGMSQRNQEQLFTMFKRFHDHVEGSGIGLYIIKRIIDNAGAYIEVNSKQDEGTEFKVYFKA